MSGKHDSREEEAIIDEIHEMLYHEIEATSGPDFSGKVAMQLRIDNGKIQTVSLCRETQIRFQRPKGGT